MRALSNMFC